MKHLLLILAFLLPVCALAQFKETFDGAQLPAAWVGDRNAFTINENGQLQFDASGKRGSSSVYAPITYTPDMEWEFDLTLSFDPSNDNQARIYVYATGAPSDIMYYIQVGHNDDNVSLYRIQGSADAVRVINGRKGLLKAESSSLRVRLSMEKNMTWKLYTSLKENDYVLEDKPFIENNMQGIRPGGFVNITCKYAASSKEGMVYTFDNLRVSPEIAPIQTTPEKPDPIEPTDPKPTDPSKTPAVLQTISQENASELLLLFDKPVDVSYSSFSLSEVGEEEELYLSDDEKWVKLVWTKARIKGKSYELTYSGIVDKAGNECRGSQTIVSQYGVADGKPDLPSVSSGAVLFNEIMADPAGATEYVELHNVSGKAIQLNGWTFCYGDNVSVALSACLLPADGYVVLYREGRALEVDQDGQRMPLAKFPSALANTGKYVALKEAAGNRVDEATYEKAKPGISWERSAEGWSLSTDPRGGTPGSVNSVAQAEPEEPEEPEEPDVPEEPETPQTSTVLPSDIVFNELLPEPYPEGAEYIELYNRSGKPASLAGLSVATRKADGSLGTAYPLSSILQTLPADGFALLTKDEGGVTPFYLISAPKAIHELKLPVLSNVSATLVLFRSLDGVVVDEVSYSYRWHAPSVKNKKGVAMERIAPDARTQESANWTSASVSAGYGTPGYRNSQAATTGGSGLTSIEPPLFIEATGFYSIVYHLNEPGYNCQAQIFDLGGRRVAEIANHELLAMEGSLTWDGIASTGSRLATGIYILYIKLYHINGQTQTYKQAFPVR